MAEKKAEEKNEKPKKKLNLALIAKIGGVSINLIGLVGGLWLVYSSTLGTQTISITEEKLKIESEFAAKRAPSSLSDPLVYTFEKFVVNLSGEPRRMIQLEVSLEMLSKDGFEEVYLADNKTKARDRIVKLLGAYSFSDLDSIQGKLFLKEKITSEMNSILKKGLVKDVYFSDFVVK